MLPVIELVDRILQRLKALFEDSENLRKKYGLVDSDTRTEESKKLKKFRSNLNNALHASGMKKRTTPAAEDDDNEVTTAVPRRASTLKRLRWGVRDKGRFQELVEVVESYVLKLTRLLNDAQQTRLAEDRGRLNALIAGSIDDPATLQIVRRAAQAGTPSDPIYNLFGRLALSDRMTSAKAPLVRRQFLLSPADFPCLGEIRGSPPARILTQHTDAVILLERKAYPVDVP
jgi:hypothetical protein